MAQFKTSTQLYFSTLYNPSSGYAVMVTIYETYIKFTLLHLQTHAIELWHW